MALIQCTECNREISDRASSCPGCGAPVTTEAQSQPTATDAAAHQVQTVELTGKQWKAWQLIGALILFLGVFLAVGGGAANAIGMMQVGIFLFILGIVTYAGARIAAWWHHG